MARFVIRRPTGALEIVETSGFVPTDALCPAPEDAAPDDGDVLDLFVDGQGKATAVLNYEKRRSKESARLQQKTDQDKREVRLSAIRAKLKGIKPSDLDTVAEIKAFIIDLVELLGLKDAP